MTRMLDAYHDAYHAEAPDYINCPYCADELLLTGGMPEPHAPNIEEEWGFWLEATYDPDNGHIDRLEDLD